MSSSAPAPVNPLERAAATPEQRTSSVAANAGESPAAAPQLRRPSPPPAGMTSTEAGFDHSRYDPAVCPLDVHAMQARFNSETLLQLCDELQADSEAATLAAHPSLADKPLTGVAVPSDEHATVFHSQVYPALKLRDVANSVTRRGDFEWFVGIVSIALARRTFAALKCGFSAFAVHRLFLGCTYVTQKIMYDVAYDSHGYSRVTGASRIELNRMERAILRACHFAVRVSGRDVEELLGLAPRRDDAEVSSPASEPTAVAADTSSTTAVASPSAPDEQKDDTAASASPSNAAPAVAPTTATPAESSQPNKAEEKPESAVTPTPAQSPPPPHPQDAAADGSAATAARDDGDGTPAATDAIKGARSETSEPPADVAPADAAAPTVSPPRTAGVELATIAVSPTAGHPDAAASEDLLRLVSSTELEDVDLSSAAAQPSSAAANETRAAAVNRSASTNALVANRETLIVTPDAIPLDIDPKTVSGKPSRRFKRNGDAASPGSSAAPSPRGEHDGPQAQPDAAPAPTVATVPTGRPPVPVPPSKPPQPQEDRPFDSDASPPSQQQQQQQQDPPIRVRITSSAGLMEDVVVPPVPRRCDRSSLSVLSDASLFSGSSRSDATWLARRTSSSVNSNGSSFHHVDSTLSAADGGATGSAVHGARALRVANDVDPSSPIAVAEAITAGDEAATATDSGAPN